MKKLFLAMAPLLTSQFALAEQAPAIQQYLGTGSGIFGMTANPSAASSPAATNKEPGTAATPKSGESVTGPGLQAAPAPEAAPAIPYWDEPFDPTVSALKTPVMGNDIRQLYAKLAAIKAADQSGGTDQCSLGGKLRCDSTLAFYDRVVLDPNYDAATETMTLTFPLNDESLYSVSRRTPGRYVVVEIANKTVTDRISVRQGMDSAPLSILRTRGEIWALSITLNNLAPIISRVSEGHYEGTLKIQMPAALVPEFMDGILQDVGFLYVGTLGSDPAYDDDDYGAARTTWPYVKDVRRHSLKFRLNEIWVVNRTTGRIYGKQVIAAAD